MTTEEIERRAELYSALAEGKTIHVKNTDGKWTDVEPQKLNYIPEELVFRVNPEPKYRPFRTQEECWNEMHKHPDFGFVKVLEDNTFSSITGLSKDFVCVLRCLDSFLPFFSFEQSFQMLTFMDGTPFGIKEE